MKNQTTTTTTKSRDKAKKTILILTEDSHSLPTLLYLSAYMKREFGVSNSSLQTILFEYCVFFRVT